jgi:HAD superfamily hydrolase (TIGR01509 family)
MGTPIVRRGNANGLATSAFRLGSTRLVLFDLDGVLFDTLPVIRVAWRHVRDKHGISASFDDYAQHLGRPFNDILHMLGLDLPPDLSTSVLATYRTASAEHSDMAVPFPGIQELVHALASAGLLVGVVTSKPRETAGPLLDRLACPLAVIRTPGSERGKPAPDSLLLALTDVGVDPVEAVYLGDMAVDQQAARRAGVPYLHAGWGYGTPETSDSIVLPQPSALTSSLSDLRNLDGEARSA